MKANLWGGRHGLHVGIIIYYIYYLQYGVSESVLKSYLFAGGVVYCIVHVCVCVIVCVYMCECSCVCVCLTFESIQSP